MHAPIYLAFQFYIRHQFKKIVLQQQQKSRHSNNISNLHSASDIFPRLSQQNIYIDRTDVRDRRPLRPRRACCSAAPPLRAPGPAGPASLCRRYAALAAAEPQPSRAFFSAAPPHHFAVATPTKTPPRRARRSAAPRITLWSLRLRK